MDRIIDDELVRGGYLDVVSGLQLAVEHVVLLHAHESGIGIRLAITVPFPKDSFLPFEFGDVGREVLVDVPQLRLDLFIGTVI